MYKSTLWILLVYLTQITLTAIFGYPPTPPGLLQQCNPTQNKRSKSCVDKCVLEKQQILSPDGRFDWKTTKEVLLGDYRLSLAPALEARFWKIGRTTSCSDAQLQWAEWIFFLILSEAKCERLGDITGSLDRFDQTETRCYRLCKYQELFPLINATDGRVNVDQGVLHHLTVGQPVYPENLREKFVKCFRRINAIRTCDDMRQIDNCDSDLKKSFFNSRRGWFYQNPDYKKFRKACLKETGLKDLYASSTYQNLLFYKCVDKKTGVIKSDDSLDVEKMVLKVSKLPGVTKVGVNATTHCLVKIAKVGTYEELYKMMLCKQHLLDDLFFQGRSNEFVSVARYHYNSGYFQQKVRKLYLQKIQ